MSIKQVLVKLGDKPYYSVIERELEGMETVLDLGCGADSPLSQVAGNYTSVGVDLFMKSIEISKLKKIHDKYIQCDVTKINEKVKPKSFDVVIALDLIEHLDKKEGIKLLDKVEKIATKKVIIMTPNGYYDQEPYGGNPYQVHRSGWLIEDFKQRSYRVGGLRGLKWLRGEQATLKYKPWLFWGLLSSFSQLFLYRFPSLSYQLFAVKELNE